VKGSTLVVEWYAVGRGKHAYALYMSAPADRWTEWSPRLRWIAHTFKFVGRR
jgi:hypothetical protein